MDESLRRAVHFEGEQARRTRICAERDRRHWGPPHGSATVRRRFHALELAAHMTRGAARHGWHALQPPSAVRCTLAEIRTCAVPRLP